MRNRLFFFFVVLILAVGGWYVYTYYEIPFIEKNKVEYVNLSIIAREGANRVETGYVVSSSQGYQAGNTSRTYELIQVPKNEIVKIYNVNIEDQRYFKDLREVNLTEDFRISLDLVEIKPINYKVYDKRILELYSEDARDIHLCFRYSVNYIDVKPEGMNLIERPKGLTKYRNCYGSDIDLKDNHQNITINYKLFGLEKENDYFEVGILQKDFLDLEPIIVKIK